MNINEPLKEEGGFGDAWKKIYRFAAKYPRFTLIIIFALFGAVIESPKYVEKVSPKLNSYLHADVSDSADAEYQMMKMNQAMDKWNKVVDKITGSLPEMQAYLADKGPILEDAQAHLNTFKKGWESELATTSVPDGCKESVRQMIKNFSDYFVIEQRFVSLMRTPDLANPSEEFKKAFKQTEQQEDVATKNMADWTAAWNKNPHICDGY
jgi:hypothetical protein